MRLLFIALQYDYGKPSRGNSYEYENFFGTLSRMPGIEASFFGFDRVMREKGLTAMNAELIRTVEVQRPDVCFFCLFTDEIMRETLTQIKDKGGVQTVNWFADDHWRFENYSRFWAPCFHWVATTDSAAVEKYRAIGCENVIKTQWGFSHFRVQEQRPRQDFGVTFVGQVHSTRRKTVGLLRRAGIEIRCWGNGWEDGRLDATEMISTYLRSKVNLNFAESSVAFAIKPVAKVFVNRRADDSIRLNTPVAMARNSLVLFRGRHPQIKARTFEIPGVGGFLLTSHADNLGDYFEIGKEIATFSDNGDLIEKIRYYLSHDAEREAIRTAGHERAMRDHTYEKRFRELLATISGSGKKD